MDGQLVGYAENVPKIVAKLWKHWASQR
jgi:hypothetical protein